MTEAEQEVDPSRIRRGRRMTAGYAGLLALVGAGGVAVIETGHWLVGASIVAGSVLGEVGLAGIYYAGDGDLSPHRDQARHFAETETQ